MGSSKSHGSLRKHGQDGPELADSSSGTVALIKLARSARMLVNVSGTVLVLLFGWLKFKDIDFGPIVKGLPADVLFKCTLALYFLCWVYGLKSDTDNQELVYKKVPKEGRMPIGGYASAVVITIVFAALCWVHSYQTFAIVLAAFLSINITSWLYLVKRVLPEIVEHSSRIYVANNEYAELEKLNLVARDYLSGEWQWARFTVGGFVVLLLSVMAFTSLPSVLSIYIGSVSTDLIMSAMVFLFVAVMETWIWLKRIKLKANLNLLDRMKLDYQFRSHQHKLDEHSNGGIT
jgi:hypothetical protein